MRLIDADALKEYIDMQKVRPFIGCTIGEALKMMTDEQPTIVERKTVSNEEWIQARGGWTNQPERKTGRWNVYYHTPKDFSYSCNQCGYSAPYGLYGGEYSQKKWDFCPNCGARMER